MAAYPQLTQPLDGLAGHITARAEAHTIRLALLYALLDGHKQIRSEHLHAAPALWDYTSRSARWALGQATGDPLAEQLHAALIRAPDGLTRTQPSQPALTPRAPQPPRRTTRPSTPSTRRRRPRTPNQDQHRRAPRRPLARRHPRLNPGPPLWGRGALLRGSPADTDVSGTGHGRKTPAPTITP